MIRAAYIEEYGPGKTEPEMRDLMDELTRRDIPTQTFTVKRLQRRQLALTRETLVAGAITTVEQALRQLDIEPPTSLSYPDCLRLFLRRRIWESTVGAVTSRSADGWTESVFVKPKERSKRFTGFVLASSADLMYFEGAARRTPVYCAEVVTWRSEWRSFIIAGNVIDTRWYDGNPELLVDDNAVRAAVRIFEDSGDAPAAYAVDFGVLTDGRTALIEVNDGFSLGSYGLTPKRYADLTIARWSELTGTRGPEDKALAVQ